MELKSPGFIAVHIGAGHHSHTKFQEYKKVCKQACIKAIEAMRANKSALDALTIAIQILEDCPLTNAGTGSNLNNAGYVECDASIMDGATTHFGAVAALKGLKNPIIVAKKLIKEQSTVLPGCLVPPIFLCGDGAQKWAIEHGVPNVTEQSLMTENSIKSFKKYTALAQQCSNNIESESIPKRLKLDIEDETKLDTVGAVCLDRYGNLCSGVSSGGLILKHPGRIGQAAVYGAGCWATNMSSATHQLGMACSSSGCGEQLIKTSLCKTCYDHCKYDRDGLTIVQEVLQQHFLGSNLLSKKIEKSAGIMLLRCRKETSTFEGGENLKVDFTWGHTTQTMAVGYMATDDEQPKFQLTALEQHCKPGQSVLMQGIVKNYDRSHQHAPNTE